eukprot:2429201-Alexandrium_andersonii.AAC.1
MADRCKDVPRPLGLHLPRTDQSHPPPVFHWRIQREGPEADHGACRAPDGSGRTSAAAQCCGCQPSGEGAQEQ